MNNQTETNTVTGNGSSYLQDCARDCCVESCLECTCKRCNDSWTENHVEDCCDETCDECKCEECCDEPWVETTPEEPCDECTCEECCEEPWVETTPEKPCDESKCEESCEDPWVETTPEEPCEECKNEECCEEPWVETTPEEPCEECKNEECCEEPWVETTPEEPCEECKCEECREEPWVETTPEEPCDECTCEECPDESWVEATPEEPCEECKCEECREEPWVDTTPEEPCEECKCEECCDEPWVEITPEEPCDECTCEECPDESWVEATPEKPCDECKCEECPEDPWVETTPEEPCDECKCEGCCEEPWVETTPEEPCDECTCEECCEEPWVETTPEEPCDECKCEESCEEPWVETTPEEPCEEYKCEESPDEPWVDTTPEESYNENEGSESYNGTGSNSCGGEGTKKFKIKSFRAVLKVGEKTALISFLRCGTAIWSSDNPDVATVDPFGVVTAKGEGTAIITATYGNYKGTYTVAVDSRKLVKVEKDGDYFIATFEGSAKGQGDKWKSIGCDMENNENRSGYPIYATENQYLLTHEVNHKHNFEQPFTPEQLAVLYRLDPYGVVYYVKERSRMNLDTLEKQLLYKDEVYCAIFETNHNRFHFRLNSDGVPVYINKYSDRKNVFTMAEYVFGKHTILEFDWLDFAKSAIEAVFEIVGGYMTGGLVDFIGYVFTAVELSQLLFFSASVTGAVNSTAKEWLENRFDEDKWKNNGLETDKMKTAKRILACSNGIFTLISGAIGATDFITITDIDICKKLKESETYCVVFEDGAFEFALEQIISLATEN